MQRVDSMNLIPFNLHITATDRVIHDLDATGYSATYYVVGVDAQGNEWCWFEYHTFDARAGVWLEVEVRGMERIEEIGG